VSGAAPLAGQVVVVTGGTRGIGKAIAEVFLADGAEVIATGTSPDDVAARNAAADRPSGLRFDHVDLGDAGSTEAFCGRLRALPRVDVLVNNAGINQIVPIAGIRDADFDRLLRIDLQAPLFLTQAVAAGMQERTYGRVVNIASIWSILTKPGRAMYTSAKAGLAGLTRTMAAEFGAAQVLVNTVSPGFTRTDLTASTLGPDEMERLAAQVPMRRFAEPVEIARVVRFLAGPENTYLTGQNIVVDGGFTCV
jgi:NAD(P)-dependent dehydrogenase (short-subunit alcohol dehydrogenase family)